MHSDFQSKGSFFIYWLFTHSDQKSVIRKESQPDIYPFDAKCSWNVMFSQFVNSYTCTYMHTIIIYIDPIFTFCILHLIIITDVFCCMVKHEGHLAITLVCAFWTSHSRSSFAVTITSTLWRWLSARSWSKTVRSGAFRRSGTDAWVAVSIHIPPKRCSVRLR